MSPRQLEPNLEGLLGKLLANLGPSLVDGDMLDHSALRHFIDAGLERQLRRLGLDVNDAVLQLKKRIDDQVTTLGENSSRLPVEGGLGNCNRRVLRQIALDVDNMR